jgi:hypothetical protein
VAIIAFDIIRMLIDGVGNLQHEIPDGDGADKFLQAN